MIALPAFAPWCLAVGGWDPGDSAFDLASRIDASTYRAVGIACLLILLAAALAPFLRDARREDCAPDDARRGRRWPDLLAHPALFALGIASAVFAWRWPELTYGQLNLDEGINVSRALRLWLDPVYWRSQDGTNTGPVVFYPLSLCYALGLAPTFGTSRLVGLIYTSATLVLLARVLRDLIGHAALARVAALPVILCCCFLDDLGNMVSFNGESPGNLLLVAGWWFLVRLWNRDGAPVDRWAIYGLGFVLGWAPFAKPQTIPAGLTLALAGYLVLLSRSPSRRACARASLWLTAGGLTGALTMVAMALVFGQGEVFYRAFFLGSLAYGSGASFGAKLSQFPEYLLSMSDLRRAFIALGACTLALPCVAYWLRRTTSPRLRFFGATSLAFTAATLFAIFRPGTMFGHYLWFLVPALGICAGLLVAIIWEARDRLAADRHHPLLVGLTAAALLVSIGCFGHRFMFRPLFYEPASSRAPSPGSQALLNFTREGDSFAGWLNDSRYTPETGLPQATRTLWAHERLAPRTTLHHSSGDSQAFWLRVFLSDWRASEPAMFLDDHQGPEGHHEVVPELRELVAEGFTLVDAVRASRPFLNQRARVYVSKARLAELLGSGPPLPLPQPDDLGWARVPRAGLRLPVRVEEDRQQVTFLGRASAPNAPLRVRLLAGEEAVYEQVTTLPQVVGPCALPGRVPAGAYVLELRPTGAADISVARLRVGAFPER